MNKPNIKPQSKGEKISTPAINIGRFTSVFILKAF